jgi:translation elongation factor EF-4
MPDSVRIGHIEEPQVKQREGKKRMRQYGNVEIPQSAFIAALKMGDA